MKVSFSFLLGERLKGERIRLGLTQIGLAEKAGQSREMLGKYERGAAEPGAGALVALASAGVDVRYVLTGETVSDAESGLSRHESELLKDYRYATEENQAAARKVVCALAGQGRASRVEPSWRKVAEDLAAEFKRNGQSPSLDEFIKSVDLVVKITRGE